MDKRNQRRGSVRRLFFYCVFLIFVVLALLYLHLHDGKEEQSGNGVDLKEKSIAVPSVTIKKKKTVDTKRPTSNCTSILNGKKRRRIAYAITITKDGFFQDGAAVLAYSIIKSSKHQCEFDIAFVAFVHPSVITSRPMLTKLGFHVIEAPKPINVTAISPDFPFLRDKIDKNGCCGSLELIKLNSYRLTQYEWVVHMDADTFLLNPISELFNTSYSLIYTTDPNMATFKQERSEPAQGGFLVLKPSELDYKEIINVIMTKGFFEGDGWDHSAIGWFWGGMTVQGVLPYYYNVVSLPGRSMKVDRCVYNTMADTADCIKKPIKDIKSAHFTICQKPWYCYDPVLNYDPFTQGVLPNPLCVAIHRRWFDLREEAEVYFGMPVQVKPCGGGKNGKKYIPMAIDWATLPVSRYTPDDSPDLLLPIGNAGIRPDAPYEEYKYSTNIIKDKS